MSTAPNHASRAQFVRTMQIVAGGLIVGVVIFGGVAAFMARGGAPGDPFVEHFAAGFALFSIVGSFVVPRVMAAAKRIELRRSGPGIASEPGEGGEELSVIEWQLYLVCQSQMIVGMSLLEGAAFFNLIAHVIGRHTWSLGVAAVLLAFQVARYPTASRVESWVGEQRRLLEMEA